jgi:DNA-directed RNA polymerase subunit H (RpoH/RPB5)
MKKQGYKTDDYENFSISEVSIMKQNNQMDMLLEKNYNSQEKVVETRKIYIRYYLNKLGPNNIQEMIDDLFNLEEILTKHDTLFIIIKDNVNETLINKMKHIWDTDGIFIVIESIKNLQFNILEHVLVPPHRVLNETETNTIMQKYNLINKEQLPEISRFDPVARIIGIKPNEVCHILRPSKTAIEADYYRVCV